MCVCVCVRECVSVYREKLEEAKIQLREFLPLLYRSQPWVKFPPKASQTDCPCVSDKALLSDVSLIRAFSQMNWLQLLHPLSPPFDKGQKVIEERELIRQMKFTGVDPKINM